MTARINTEVYSQISENKILTSIILCRSDNSGTSPLQSIITVPVSSNPLLPALPAICNINKGIQSFQINISCMWKAQSHPTQICELPFQYYLQYQYELSKVGGRGRSVKKNDCQICYLNTFYVHMRLAHNKMSHKFLPNTRMSNSAQKSYIQSYVFWTEAVYTVICLLNRSHIYSCL